jgi:hypothetical protein
MRLRNIAILEAILGLLLAAAPAIPGAAQEAAPFYRGKTIRIVISTGVAGGYAEYARLLADHMGAHIAGQPGFIVQSMPGAGGLLAANYLYTQAPQDGTTFGIVHSSVPLTPLWGNKGARFDSLKFNWLGSLDRTDGMCIAWHASPIKTWADMLAHEFTVGSSGAGSQMDTYPAVLNRLFGTKLKVIAGYKDGTDVYLAMERGEIDGRCGGQLTVIKATRPQWLTEHKIAADPHRRETQRRVPRHAHDHGIRQGRGHPPAARAADGVAEPRSARDDAPGRAGRAGGAALASLRRHHGGCGLPAGRRAQEPPCRPLGRGGDGERARPGVRIAPGGDCGRSRDDGRQVKSRRPRLRAGAAR